LLALPALAVAVGAGSYAAVSLLKGKNQSASLPKDEGPKPLPLPPPPLPPLREQTIEIPDQIWGITVSYDGRFLAVGYGNGQHGGVILFERSEQGFKVKWRKQEDASCWGVAISPTEPWLAVAVQGEKEAVRVWDVVADRPVEWPASQGLNGQPRSLAFSPDGTELAAGISFWGEEKKSVMVRLWDTTGQRKFRDLTTPGRRTGSVRGVSFSADGSLLVASDDNATPDTAPGCMVWDVASGEYRWDFSDEKAGIASAEFARAYPRLACARLKTVRCFALPKFEPFGKPIEVQAEPEMIALSPNGKLVAIKLDSRVEVRDTETGQLRQQFNAPASAWTLTFTPDGKNLIGGHIDKLVRVWVISEPS
jgi:WD40 repeat protein